MSDRSASTITCTNIAELLERDGVIASVTEGVSMRPLFKTHRDMVVIRRAQQPLQKYDVALYKHGDKYIFHRVIGIDASRNIYIIRGDNTYRRELVPFDAVIGVLESFNRKGKHVQVSDGKYRLYSRVWTAIYPVRYLIRLPYAAVQSVLRRIKRAIKKQESAKNG